MPSSSRKPSASYDVTPGCRILLDLHALTNTTGATTLTAVNTVPANDGQATAGVPIAGNAALVGWGGFTTIADTIKEIKLVSQDQIDPVNGEDYVTGGTASGIIHLWDYLSFLTGQRQLSMAQNTGANPEIAYTIDLYPGGPVRATPIYGINGKNGYYSQVFSGALTANTYGTQSFSPTNAIPAGKWAIQGAWVSSLTNYALIRFLHADFGAFSPGFPVVDPNQTIARANTPLERLLLTPGYQFSIMSEILKVPCEPIFTVQANATGLRLQMIDITADTPQVFLNLVKVG